MRNEWQAVRLGDIAKVSAGNPAPQAKELFESGTHPFFRTADAGRVRFGVITASTDYLNEEGVKGLRRYPVGTILFPKSGASTFLNHRVLLGVEGYVASHLATIVADESMVRPRFLLYALSLISAQDLVQDHAYPSLNLRTISEVNLRIPSLRQQDIAIQRLDEVFEATAVGRDAALKNVENAHAIFEAELRALFTPADHTSQCTSVAIGEVAEVFDGPHATPKTVDSGPIFLGISALQDGRVNLGETRHVTPQDFKQWTRRVRPQDGDVVFAYETRLGQAAIIPPGLECCLGRRMGLVRVDPHRVDPRYFVYQYVSPPFREFLASKTVRGATVDRIPLKDFRSYQIQLPPLDAQRAIADKIDRLRDETDSLATLFSRKVSLIDELRKSVLGEAVGGSGGVAVP